MSDVVQQLINGIALGSVYALLALGVTVVWGVLNVMNFAHGQLLTWGTFATAAAVSAGVPLIPGILLGMLASAVLAVLIERLVVSPLKERGRTDEFGFVVATIGVSLLLSTVIKLLTDSEVRSFPGGFPEGSLDVAGVSIPTLQLIVLGSTGLVMVALLFWLHRTPLGRALRTVAYSRETALLLGINARLVFIVAFAISGALAGLAGTFVAAQTSVMSYSAGDTLLVLAFAAVVVGGMGSVPGALAGGLLLGIGEVMLSAYVSSDWQSVFPFLLMALVLLVRPAGLFRTPEASRA